MRKLIGPTLAVLGLAVCLERTCAPETQEVRATTESRVSEVASAKRKPSSTSASELKIELPEELTILTEEEFTKISTVLQTKLGSRGFDFDVINDNNGTHLTYLYRENILVAISLPNEQDVDTTEKINLLLQYVNLDESGTAIHTIGKKLYTGDDLDTVLDKIVKAIPQDPPPNVKKSNDEL